MPTVTTTGRTGVHGQRDQRRVGLALGGGLNLAGTRVHGAFLVDTKVTDAWVHSLDLSGNIQSLVANGVEVAGYVQAELERRHPELGYLGSMDVPGLQRATRAGHVRLRGGHVDSARRGAQPASFSPARARLEGDELSRTNLDV
jgi:hypothetical protein